MARIPIEQEFAALLRSDFHGFIERSFYELNPTTEFRDNWHIHVIAHELEQVRLGNSTRLIINVPPRSLKSHCASVAFPGWVLGHEPSSQIICAIKADGQAASSPPESNSRGPVARSTGMVAAATMSLPERAREGRNYDYRYVWIRDQCFTGQAVAKAGPLPLLDDAVRFVGDRLLADGDQMMPAYTTGGDLKPAARPPVEGITYWDTWGATRG